METYYFARQVNEMIKAGITRWDVGAMNRAYTAGTCKTMNFFDYKLIMIKEFLARQAIR
jgi:hypothetical protein